MNFLPVVERELRIAARRKGTFRSRMTAAIVSLLLGGGMWLTLTQSMWSGAGSQGKLIFIYLSWLAFLYCLVEGARTAADCLSQEKREGTLGLLFLTDLKGYDVVAGKLAAHSLNAFFTVMAIMPMLSLSLLMGGVTIGEFWRVFLALLCTLFLSMSVGIWISSRSRLEHRALAAAAVVICLISFGPLCLDYGLYMNHTTSGTWIFSLLSPWFGFTQTNDATYFLHADRYWFSLASSVLLGGCFLLIASRTLGGKWQDSVRKDSALKRSAGAFLHGGREQKLRFRRQQLNVNPILWIAARGRVQWKWFVAVVGPTVALIIFYMIRSGDADAAYGVYYGVYGVFNWVFSLALKIIICWLACKAFIEARQNGALELWLCTPLKIDQILDGQRLALRRVWLAALYLVAAVTVAFLAIGLFETGGAGGGFSKFSEYQLPAVLSSIAIFVADMIALGWVGMWFGLTSRGVTQAITRTYVYVIIVPWLVISIGWTLLFSFGGARDFATGGISIYLIGHSVLFLLKDLFFFLWARKNLRSQFRTVASEGVKKPKKKRTKPPPLPSI